MKILVLRHGRTALNERGIFNGQYDEPLSDHGREDAWAARTNLDAIIAKQHLAISQIYCSPLSRTFETYEIAAGHLDLTPTLDPRLMERTMGSLDNRDLGMSGFNLDDLFNFHYDPELPGFENWPTFFTRVHHFMDDLLAAHPPASDDTVLIVTHGGTARAIYYYFNPVPADGSTDYPPLHNCDICEFNLTPTGNTYHADYTLLT